MRTSKDTQAPLATNFSAATTCLGSSRATSRTRRLVSTARMALPDMAPNALLHLLRALAPDHAFGEQRVVNILGVVPPSAPHDDLSVHLVPLEDGPRVDAEHSTDFRRHGDLTLSREF